MSQTDSRNVKIRQRRLLVAELYLHRHIAPEIHQLITTEGGIECDLKTVYRDIKALEALWSKELVEDPVALKGRELAEIEQAEAECWRQYGLAPARLRRLWLMELRNWKERKAKLLGLDAPAKLDVKSGPIEVSFTIGKGYDDEPSTPPSGANGGEGPGAGRQVVERG